MEGSATRRVAVVLAAVWRILCRASMRFQPLTRWCSKESSVSTSRIFFCFFNMFSFSERGEGMGGSSSSLYSDEVCSWLRTSTQRDQTSSSSRFICTAGRLSEGIFTLCTHCSVRMRRMIQSLCIARTVRMLRKAMQRVYASFSMSFKMSTRSQIISLEKLESSAGSSVPL